VAEEYRVGGTCVIRGCVPKKLFVYASHFARDFETAKSFGWTIDKAEFDWPTLIANKDAEIDRLNAVYIRNLKAAGAELFLSRATLAGPNTVHIEAEGRDITAKTILIATGGWPFIPEIPGAEHVITSNEAFHLETLPDHITVVGGGFIAVEFACIFNGMGVDVSLLYRGEQILRGFDDDLRDALHDEMIKSGIDVRVMCDVMSIEREGEMFELELKTGHRLQTGLVMYATGRRPNVTGLGLEAAGVEQGPSGQIAVDAWSKTNIDSIYAVGDVTDRVSLTPVAIREGHAFADTVFGGKSIAVDHSDIASAVFSQPEIGTVGLTEAQARERFESVVIYRSTFRPMKLSLSELDEKMMMKLVVDGVSDRVVGCHILGDGAGEMAQLLGIAVKMGATKADFDATMALHPTAAEELVTMREPVKD